MINTKLSRLISDKKINFFFRIESIADIHAATGFIHVLGIHKKRVVISFGSEATEKITKAAFKGCTFTTRQRLSKNHFPVTFDTDGKTRLAGDGHLIATYDPFKYCGTPVRSGIKEKLLLRQRMKIKKDRKFVVVSCSTTHEISAIIRAYENLNSIKKPLLMLGLRKPNGRLEKKLAGKTLKVHERRFVDEPLFLLGRADVIVLNTMGELTKFLVAADLAILGYERNLFEPAQLGIPVLYFGQPLNINRSEIKMARLFRLYWRKNRTARRLLDKFGGAVRIDQKRFGIEIDHILNRPEPMIRGARRAVYEFHHQIVPKIRLRTIRMLEKGITRFNGNFD